MKTLRGYFFVILLLVLAMSCSMLSSPAQDTPQASPSATAESGSSGTNVTATVPVDTGPTFPVELVSTWTFENAPEPPFEPFHFAVDSEGNFYFINQGSGDKPPKFLKFDSSGQFLGQLGTYGEGEGQFGAPNGLAVDSQGNVYISDAYNIPIQKYDKEGKYLAGWGTQGANNGEFRQAGGITVDGQGNIFVVDVNAKPGPRVQKFDSNGNFLTLWDARAEQAENANAFDITADQQGNVYLYIPGPNYRVIKFDTAGQVLAEWAQPVCETTQIQGTFGGIWVDAQSQVYITDAGEGRICVFDANGVSIGSWGKSSFDVGQYFGPIDIVGDDAGNIYVLESYRVLIFHIGK